MKFKVLVLTVLFAAGTVSSVAVAKGPPGGKDKGSPSSSSTTTAKGKGKGKDKATAPATSCKRSSVILKGTFVSGSADEFTMDVKQSNAHGRRWVGEEATLEVDDKTKVRRRGNAEMEDFEAGDWLNVQARACKERSTAGSSTGAVASDADPKLIARRVVGKPAKNGSTTTTTTASP